MLELLAGLWQNWKKVRCVNIHHALIGLASFNTVEIREHMKEAGIINLMPVRKHRKGRRPGEFTEELTRIAECRGSSEVEDLGEA